MQVVIVAATAHQLSRLPTSAGARRSGGAQQPDPNRRQKPPPPPPSVAGQVAELCGACLHALTHSPLAALASSLLALALAWACSALIPCVLTAGACSGGDPLHDPTAAAAAGNPSGGGGGGCPFTAARRCAEALSRERAHVVAAAWLALLPPSLLLMRALLDGGGHARRARRKRSRRGGVGAAAAAALAAAVAATAPLLLRLHAPLAAEARRARSCGAAWSLPDRANPGASPWAAAGVCSRPDCATAAGTLPAAEAAVLLALAVAAAVVVAAACAAAAWLLRAAVAAPARLALRVVRGRRKEAGGGGGGGRRAMVVVAVALVAAGWVHVSLTPLLALLALLLADGGAADGPGEDASSRKAEQSLKVEERASREQEREGGNDGGLKGEQPAEADKEERASREEERRRDAAVAVLRRGYRALLAVVAAVLAPSGWSSLTRRAAVLPPWPAGGWRALDVVVGGAGLLRRLGPAVVFASEPWDVALACVPTALAAAALLAAAGNVRSGGAGRALAVLACASWARAVLGSDFLLLAAHAGVSLALWCALL